MNDEDDRTTGGRARVFLGGMSRRAGRLGLVLLVLAAVYVGAGRLLAPLASGQKDAVEDLLSRRLGAEVSIAALDVGWRWFSPLVSLRGLRIRMPPSQTSADPGSHGLDSLDIQLDVPRSLWRRQWATAGVEAVAPTLELVETAPGRWTMAGFGGGNAAWGDTVVDLLLNTAHLRLRDATLILRPADGEAIMLRDGALELRNRDGVHQLLVEAALREGREPLRLQLELEGDPRGEFSARAHADLRLDQALDLAPALYPEAPLRSLDGRARLWAFADSRGLRELRGVVEDLELLADTPAAPSLPALREGSAVFHARRGAEQGRWQLWLEEPGFTAGDATWRSGEIFLELDLAGEEPAFDLQATSLDLGPAGGLLLALDVLPPAGAAVLRDLAPRGALTNLRMRADLANPDSARLAANLNGVGVGAWKGVPAMEGISGYVEAGPAGGFVELDAPDFGLHLPLLFPEPWHYQRVNSRVTWSLEPGAVHVHSSVIDARGEDIHGRVQFALAVLRGDSGVWETDFDLRVGVLQADAAVKNAYLPDLPALAGTLDWLEDAILSGRLKNSGLVLRGHFGPERLPGAISAQSFYHVRDVSLNYLAGWPHINGVSGYVRVNDTEAEIRADGGETAGILLDPADATLRGDPAGGSWLSLRGGAGAGSAQGLDFLRDSPLRDNIGPHLDEWEAEGELRVDMNLRIPLGVAGAVPDIRVAVLTGDSSLAMPEQGFLFEDVAGRIDYTSEGGLAAEGLRGRLFGFPVSAGIETFDRPRQGSVLRERGTRIHGRGKASVEALAAWPKQSDFVSRLLGFAEGEIDYQAEFNLYSEPDPDGVHASLRLSSPLAGLAVDLPEPFLRDGGEERPLELTLDFREDGEVLNTRYGGTFYGNMFLHDGRLERGMLYFGPLNQEFSVRQSDSRQPGLLVAGELAHFDLAVWREVAGVLAGGGGSGEDSVAGALRLVDMNIGRLDLLGQSLSQVNAQLRPGEDGWELSLRNAVLAGDFLLPDDPARPYEARLDYLRFPPGDQEDEAGEAAEAAEPVDSAPPRDALAGLDPASLPPIDFETGELGIGDRNLGAWRFRLRPRAGGASVDSLQVTMADAAISDESGEAGAELEWDFDGETHHTSFRGRFHAGSLAGVLSALGYDAHVESRSANLQGELAWPGSPAAFAFGGSSGDVAMDIRNGRFVNIDSGGSRLFGALSFDAIVRRLELDFSDLFGKGFVFDSIQGGLNFDQGIVTTHGMVRIVGPSSKISIDGAIDLGRQTIDADMLVTLPLSQNLTVLAGLLGAWPLAVSSYVAGKIFEEQMDEFTSLVYRLEGPWESLDGNFEVPADTPEAAEGGAPAASERPATSETSPPTPARPGTVPAE